MLARVKATGKIVDVSMESDNSTDFRKAIFRTKEGVSYQYDEIELISDKIKARVKLTGDIFEVSDTTTIYPEHYDKSYNITDVDFLDVEVMNNPCHNPDYWTRIEHQAAIAAMQGLCANAKFMQDHEGDFQCHEEMIAEYAKDIAHALMEKYKEKEK